MIIGMGTDIVDCERIQKSLNLFDSRFADKILHPTEKAQFDKQGKSHQAAWLASRFAAKEAGAKALGTGFINGISFKDFEVVRPDKQAPTMRLHGKAKEKADSLGVKYIHISYSHEKKFAVATVIFSC